MPKKAAATAAAPAAEKTKRKSPVHYTERRAQQILQRIANGERWKHFSAGDDTPCYSVIYTWAKRHPDFGAAYELAKRIGADARADKALEVAENATKESLPVDRLHVGVLKWAVERDTKIYGPRPDEPDLGAGRKVVVVVRQFENYVDEEGVTRVREITPLGEGARSGGGVR
jgi:hypothetical protein